MKKRFAAALLAALLALSLCAPASLGEGGVTYEFAFAVHAVGTDAYVRHVGPDAFSDSLGPDEYYSLYLTVHNGTGKQLRFSKAVLAVDGREYAWKDVVCGKAYSFRLGRDAMKAIGPLAHTCTFALDGKTVYTHAFSMPRDWGSAMRLPTAEQARARSGGPRSPYITFYPKFPPYSRFTEYSVDFSTDHAPTGTYVCPMNWWMDMKELEKKNKRVWNDYSGVVSGYAGLQVWNDGTHGVIMTVWDTFYETKSGETKQIKATVTYPKDASDTRHDRSSEGSFVHYSYPFDWKTGREYRMLLQLYSGEGGTKCLDLWILDIAAGKWTLLFSFDTNIREDIAMYDCLGFLEDFDTRTAGEVRTMQFRNSRALIRGKGWTNAGDVEFGVNNSNGISDYKGSYGFGADGRTGWIVTSGVTGLGSVGAQRVWKMPSSESGQPY